MSLRGITITKGIVDSMPILLQQMMWYLVATMKVKEKDYLQVFQFEKVEINGIQKQKIIHTQECPEYRSEYIVSSTNPISTKAYIIEKNDYRNMLLAEEY